jgi:hypothetical protein
MVARNRSPRRNDPELRKDVRMTTPTERRLALATALLLAAPAAEAAAMTYAVAWSGGAYGNGASATGTIFLDDALFASGQLLFGPPGSFPGAGITDFRLEVRGASIGNGDFGLADFNFFKFESDPLDAIDATTELVGQQGFRDFNIVAGRPLGPIGAAIAFTFATDNGSGENLLLTSFAPDGATSVAPVPLPISAPLLLSGLLSLAGLWAWDRARSGGIT